MSSPKINFVTGEFPVLEWGKHFEVWVVAAVVGCAECNIDQLIKYNNFINFRICSLANS